jgi:hypothetical protein
MQSPARVVGFKKKKKAAAPGQSHWEYQHVDVRKICQQKDWWVLDKCGVRKLVDSFKIVSVPTVTPLTDVMPRLMKASTASCRTTGQPCSGISDHGVGIFRNLLAFCIS